MQDKNLTSEKELIGNRLDVNLDIYIEESFCYNPFFCNPRSYHCDIVKITDTGWSGGGLNPVENTIEELAVKTAKRINNKFGNGKNLTGKISTSFGEFAWTATALLLPDQVYVIRQSIGMDDLNLFKEIVNENYIGECNLTVNKEPYKIKGESLLDLH